MSYARPNLAWLGYVVPLTLWTLAAWLGCRFIPWPDKLRWEAEVLLAWIGGLVAVAGYLGAVRLAIVPTLSRKTGADLHWARRTLAAMAFAEFLFVSACGAALVEIGFVLRESFSVNAMKIGAAWTVCGTLILVALHIVRTFEQFTKFAGGYQPRQGGPAPSAANSAVWTMTLEDATGAKWEVKAEANATTQIAPGNVTLRRV